MDLMWTPILNNRASQLVIKAIETNQEDDLTVLPGSQPHPLDLQRPQSTRRQSRSQPPFGFLTLGLDVLSPQCSLEIPIDLPP